MGIQELAESAPQLCQCAILPATRSVFRGYLCPSVGQACGPGRRDHGVSAGCVWNQNEATFQLKDEGFREERRAHSEFVPRDGSHGIPVRAVGEELLARGFVPE